jgi:plasmid stability protein
MPKTIQIRNIDDEVYLALKRRAAEDGLSVPELLRREVQRLASRPSMREWLERVGRRPVNPNIAPGHVLEVLDEWRGPWPDADH